MSALDDLIARDSGQSANTGSSLDAIIARDSGGSQSSTPTQQVTAQPPAQGNSLFGELTRQIGLTARAGVNSIAGLPMMAGDAVNSALNMIPGVHLQMPSQALGQLMDKAGVPQPQNATERIVQDVTGAMGGAGGFIKAGKALANIAAPVAQSVLNASANAANGTKYLKSGQLLANTSSPVAQGIASTMQQLPGMQIIGSAGAGAGAGIAREDGSGVFGQLGGGVVGGLLGAVGPSAAIAAARGIKGTVSNVSNTLSPVLNPQGYVGKQLATYLGPDAASIAENIRSAPEYVPGSMPTTAQVGGGSKLVATEKATSNLPGLKEQFANRSADNNAARWQVLNDVARTPEDLQAAMDARSAITQPAYAEAHANTANVGPAFMRFAQIQEMQEAMASANKIATLDAAVGRGVAPLWPTPDSKAINGAALDYTSRALGDMIGAANTSAQTTRAGSLAALKDSVDGWMGRYIPGVGDVRNDYAALSSPVNTMEAGQQIAGQLGTRGMDVNRLPQLTLDGFRSALTSATKKQKFGIDDGALQSLQGIGQDLQRASVSNSLKSPGSDSIYNIGAQGFLAKQLYGADFNGASPLIKGLAALTATVTGHPMAGAGLLASGSKLGTMVGGKLQNQLGGLLLSPNELLPFLDAVGKQTPKSLPSSLGRNINQGLLGAFSTERASP